MVEEISPSYYAENIGDVTYTLRGSGFEQIPSDAVGILAMSNGNPLELIDTTREDWLFDISEKTSSVLVMPQRQMRAHGAPTYLGAIVSADRRIVYWRNDTRPLP